MPSSSVLIRLPKMQHGKMPKVQGAKVQGMPKVLPELCKNLEAALCEQASNDPDMFLISREGKSLPAHKCVLTLFSPGLANLLASCPPHLPPSLLLPDTGFRALCGLLSLFYTGLLPVKEGEEEVLKEVEGTAAMMGLTLDLRRESSFGEEKINLEETVKVETEKEHSKKSKAKKPRKPRRSLEPRVSTPESRPSPITKRSPKPAAPDRNAELEAKLASMWGARKQTNIFENRSDANPPPIVVESPQTGSEKRAPALAGRACSLCKERFENLKELGSHIEKVHKPARGRGSPRVQSPREMGALSRPSSPLLGRKSGQRSQDFSWKMSSEEKPSKKKNVFDVPQAFNSNQEEHKNSQKRRNW